MEGNFESYSSDRNFGHCIITWEIKNYGLAVWQKYWEVETPEFFVRGPESLITKWKLILQTGLSENDTKHKESAGTESVKRDLMSGNLVLNLERSKFDQRPDTVWVDLKVYCLGIDGKKFAVTQGQQFVGNKYRYGLHLGVIFDIEREFQYNSGVMTFLCQMIIHDRRIPEVFGNFDDIDLYALSEDLQWTLTQEKFCDLKIKLGEKSILAHKAILCSHSKSLESTVKEKGFDIIDLSGADYEGMLKTLQYMYSSDLKNVSRRPSISIYDSIIRMNIPDLAAYYSPEELKICTKIDVSKLTYMWFIKDFSSKKENCLSSPIVSKNMADAAWQIHLYPRGVDGESEYIAISVEYIEGKISDELCIQCAVLKDDETFQSWKTLQRSMKVDPMFEDKKFIQREVLLKMLNGDLLKLGFKVRMCIAKENSPLYIKTNPHIPCTKFKYFKKLSQDMSYLRESSKYTDVILLVDNKEIKAHKFILSARSYVFSSMLEETEGDYLVISNITPEILNILLDYMYCAMLKVPEVKVLLDVYKAAEEFEISRLREKCSRVLRNSLTAETVCDVLSLAHDYNDQLLKAAASKFVRLNMNIFEQEVWKNLKCKKPFLCNEIEIASKQMSNEEEKNLSMLLNNEKDNLLQCNGRKVPNGTPSDDSEKSELLNGEDENDSTILMGKDGKVVAKTLHGNGIEELEVYDSSCGVEKILKEPDNDELEKLLKESHSDKTEKVLKDSDGKGIVFKESCGQEVEVISIESDGKAVKTVSIECNGKAEAVSKESDSRIDIVSIKTESKALSTVSKESEGKKLEAVLKESDKILKAVSEESDGKAVSEESGGKALKAVSEESDCKAVSEESDGKALEAVSEESDGKILESVSEKFDGNSVEAVLKEHVLSKDDPK